MAEAAFPDVPPLEDMSGMLKCINNIREKRRKSSDRGVVHTLPEDSICKMNKQEITLGNPDEIIDAGDQANMFSFGGLRKGFLASSGKPNPDQASYIAEVVSKGSTSATQLPEVQEAMKNSLTECEWITDDLLHNLTKDPALLRQLTDPRFMTAIDKFQTCPEAALKEYSSNNEIKKFLTAFCSVLGEHFVKHDEQLIQDPLKSKSHLVGSKLSQFSQESNSPPLDPQAEQELNAKTREVLQNPELRSILMEQQVQNFISALNRKDISKAERILQNNEDLKPKVMRLVASGVLSFAT